ncbi:hypothetical protein [Serinicoccus sp. CUA-874]|nr:hypothetical protein [Serinicoccus sp. CUA-874]
MTPPHTRPPKGRATGLRPVDDVGRRRGGGVSRCGSPAKDTA